MKEIPKEIQDKFKDHYDTYTNIKSYFGYVEVGWGEIRDYEKNGFYFGCKVGYQLAPDSGEYWKKRCEAAEDIYRMLNLGQVHSKEYIKWAKLKSTPIPLTPCAGWIEELERRQQIILSEPNGQVRETMIEDFLTNL